MDLYQKIQQRQYKYNNYIIQCIDAYLEGDVEPLQTFLISLLKMEKGYTVLEDDFNILVDAFKRHDIILMEFIKSKLKIF